MFCFFMDSIFPTYEFLDTYNKGDFDSYRQQLTDVDWETLFGHNDVDTIVDITTNTILNIADNTIK
jgi:hypothetical protein